MTELTEYQKKKHLPFHKQRGTKLLFLDYGDVILTNCYDKVLEVFENTIGKPKMVSGPSGPDLVDGKWVFGKTSKWKNQEPRWTIEFV